MSNAFGTDRDQVAISLDTVSPIVSIRSPSDGAETYDTQIAVEGNVSDANTISSITLNGASTVLSEGLFSGTVPLVMGGNSILVVATDAAGNSGQNSITIIRVIDTDGDHVPDHRDLCPGTP
ncbi:MAG: hypothetical protein ACRD2A_26775, partial [Vicinamibacterales bacterium]